MMSRHCRRRPSSRSSTSAVASASFFATRQTSFSCLSSTMMPKNLSPMWLLQLVLALLAMSIPISTANHMTLEVDEDFRTSFQERKVIDISDPTDIKFSPDGKLMLVTTKVGKVWAVTNFEEEDDDDSSAQRTEVLDISTRLCTNGERGLGGVAFHPQFGRSNQWVYLYYTFENDSGCYADGELGKGPVNRLSRFDMSAVVSGKNEETYSVDVDSEVVYFETPPLPKNHHNSGDIAFGKDGYLYVTVGDGGTRTNENKDGVPYSQALDKLLGKIVRLTDTGEIPPDNPYTPSNGHANSARCSLTGGEAKKADIKCQEIFASGLRNPWRFAHDPNADDVRFFINDVGRKTWERILDGKMGANYGYPFREGPCEATEEKNCQPDPKYADPIHWYRHDEEDGGAVTGAAFYPNDAGWPEAFVGSFLHAEYASGGIFFIKESSDGCSFPKCDPPISNFASSTQVLSGLKKIVSMTFGPHRDARKALYVVSRGHTGNRGDEGVFRVAFTGESPPALANTPESSKVVPSTTILNRGPTIARAEASPVFGFAPLTVDFSAIALDVDGDALAYAWDVDGDGKTDSKSPTTAHTFKSAGTYEATLTVKDGRGGKETATVTIEVDNTPPKPQIDSPGEGTTFHVGDKIKLLGSAVDVEDGNDMPKLSWEVILHHKDHFHQILPPTEGKKVKLDAPAPFDLESASSSYLVAKLTATDSSGLSTMVERLIRPEIANVVVDTEPSGLTITANEESFVTPAVITSWAGQTLSLEPPKYQTHDGIEYAFSEWSDGASLRHSIEASSSSSSPDTLIAAFRRTSPFVDIGKPADGSTFAIGDVLALTGDARDASGNPLPDESLRWEVNLYREESDDSVFETVLLSPTEGRHVEKIISDFDVLSSTPAFSRLEVVLTATDPSGSIARKKVNLQPRKVEVTFNSSPVQGLYLRLDGKKHATPVNITTWENHKINVKAPSQHSPIYDDDDDDTESGLVYVFDSWSNGGAQTHDYVASSAPTRGGRTVVTANFRPAVAWTDEVPRTNAESPPSRSAGPTTEEENSRSEGIGMIAVSAVVFVVAASAYFWKKGKTARSRQAQRYLAAQKNLSYRSGDSSTADGTPTPLGSPDRGSIVMEGFDLDDTFEDNENDNDRPPSPTGSMKFGDDGFAHSADQSDGSSSSVDAKSDSFVRALSFMKGDIV